MGRTSTPDGKRVGWSVKLSEPKSAAADLLRGSTPRAVWLASLVDAAIEAAQPGKPVVRRTRSPRTRKVSAADDQAESTPGTGYLSMAGLPGRCTHSGTRVVGGYCKECDRVVEPGGLWRVS